MTFYCYILFSQKIDKFYIGVTANLLERLKKHNSNHKGFTGKTNDWQLVYKETFNSKTQAHPKGKTLKINNLISYLYPSYLFETMMREGLRY
ncbi:GIY-YIG nuclease family protein [Sinomicrobium sp. FJxs]|uniref:GIY-YIG nuclease family protein n=2 Tax=Sinomicrobium weinanense TaxID=2842200 RepID=A0A926Q4J7_9FLAO|nr:GIY-YIG nuclease family protein [Sinomicrobium weinanense]